MKRTAALTAVVIAASAIPAPLALGKTDEATFNHRANNVCSAAGAKIAALPASAPASNPARNFTRVNKIVDSMTAKLAKIQAPAARKTKFKRFIALTRQANTLIGQGVAAARAHHVDRSADLFYKGLKAAEKSVTVATDIDLTECARDRYPGLEAAQTS